MEKLTISNVRGFPAGARQDDAIEPVAITHQIDDLRDVDEQAFYNFFVYQFERDGAAMTARAYVHDMTTVMILTATPPSGPAEQRLFDDVSAYLRRRYATVRVLHEMR